MISILMPYFGDRSDQLHRTLYMLDNQAYDEKYELVIIQDSDDALIPISTDFNFDKMKLTVSIARTGNNLPWRSPNHALKLGYEQCTGDFIIVTSPEILVPYHALQMMEDYNLHETMLVPILYKLSREDQRYIDKVNWRFNLSFLQGFTDFWATETNPGGYYNQEAVTYRHHGGFVGADRKVWDEINFMPDPEQPESDSYWHRRLLELGKTPIHVPMEVYHQWHPRHDDPEQSIRIRRLNNGQ